MLLSILGEVRRSLGRAARLWITLVIILSRSYCSTSRAEIHSNGVILSA